MFDFPLAVRVLNTIYERVTSASPGPRVESALSLAQHYLDSPKQKTLEDKMDALIHVQNAKACAVGFVTSLGGIITLPLTLPANVMGVFFIQMRMIAAIAIMSGYDLKDEKVKTMIFACMCGRGAGDVLRDVDMGSEQHLTKKILNKLSQETISHMQRVTSVKMAAKIGETGAVNMAKVVPLLGGLIAGTFDGMTTSSIGKISKKVFLDS